MNWYQKSAFPGKRGHFQAVRGGVLPTGGQPWLQFAIIKPRSKVVLYRSWPKPCSLFQIAHRAQYLTVINSRSSPLNPRDNMIGVPLVTFDCLAAAKGSLAFSTIATEYLHFL